MYGYGYSFTLLLLADFVDAHKKEEPIATQKAK